MVECPKCASKNVTKTFEVFTNWDIVDIDYIIGMECDDCGQEFDLHLRVVDTEIKEKDWREKLCLELEQ